MSLKITIEVDGHSEQQLAPALSRLAQPQSEQRPASFFQENSALVQQQVQQLVQQNQLLRSQLANHSAGYSNEPPASQALPPDLGKPDKPVAVQVMPSTLNPASDRPRLPAQYQTSRVQQLAHSFRHAATATSHRLWQVLVWIAFGKEWLALVLLLGGGLYGAFQIAPVISQRLPPLRLTAEEATDTTFKEGPRQTITPAMTPQEASNSALNPSGQEIDPTSQTDLPPLPAAIGEHPAPPPTFQDNSVDYQPR